MDNCHSLIASAGEAVCIMRVQSSMEGTFFTCSVVTTEAVYQGFCRRVPLLPGTGYRVPGTGCRMPGAGCPVLALLGRESPNALLNPPHTRHAPKSLIECNHLVRTGREGNLRDQVVGESGRAPAARLQRLPRRVPGAPRLDFETWETSAPAPRRAALVNGPRRF